MKNWYSLPPALIGVAAVAIVGHQIAAALTPREVNAIAEKITVLIANANGTATGSGVILAQEGKTYYVVTAKHVVASPSDYKVVTFNKKSYAIAYRNVIQLPEVDLAILQFPSEEVYETAKLGNSDTISQTARVHVSGYISSNAVNLGGRFIPTTGEIIQTEPTNDGYALAYTNPTSPGMSGGPVLDEDGRLVGIHGRGDGIPGSDGQQIEKLPYKLAIPLKTFVNLAPNACVDKGKEKLTRQDYEGAIADFNLALKFKPDFVAAYISRGRAYLAMGNSEKSLADASQALAINPPSPQTADAYVLRGDIRAQQNKNKEAIDDYNKAIQINQNPTFVAEINRKIATLQATVIVSPSIPTPTFTTAPNPTPTPTPSTTIATASRNWVSYALNVESQVLTVAFNPNDPTQIASGSADGKIKLWDLKTGKPRILTGNRKEVKSIAFSRDGSKLASGDRDGVTKIWDLQRINSQPKTFREAKTEVYAVAFSQDGQDIATGLSNGTIQIRRVNNGSVRRSFLAHQGGVSALVYSSNEMLASSGGDKTIKLWNMRSQGYGIMIHAFTEHTDWIYTIASSRDGQTLVSSSVDRTIKLWNVNARRLIRSIDVGRFNSVYDVAISPDGNTFASAINKEIKLWNLSNGQEVDILPGHTDLVRSLAFSRDGKLVSGSEDNTIRIWQKR